MLDSQSSNDSQSYNHIFFFLQFLRPLDSFEEETPLYRNNTRCADKWRTQLDNSHSVCGQYRLNCIRLVKKNFFFLPLEQHINQVLNFSGSCDGFIRLWQCADNHRKLKPLLKIPLQGFINSLVFNSSLGSWRHLVRGRNDVKRFVFSC